MLQLISKSTMYKTLQTSTTQALAFERVKQAWRFHPHDSRFGKVAKYWNTICLENVLLKRTSQWELRLKGPAWRLKISTTDSRVKTVAKYWNTICTDKSSVQFKGHKDQELSFERAGVTLEDFIHRLESRTVAKYWNAMCSDNLKVQLVSFRLKRPRLRISSTDS